MNKYYDEFKELKLDTMAQKMSDMTYNYENTRVPKEHYKKMLSVALMELESGDINVEMNLLNPYVELMNKLQKENPKYFFKALLLIDNKISVNKVDVITYESLEFAWQFAQNEKIKNYINENITDVFKEYIKNGIEENDEDILDTSNIIELNN